MKIFKKLDKTYSTNCFSKWFCSLFLVLLLPIFSLQKYFSTEPWCGCKCPQCPEEGVWCSWTALRGVVSCPPWAMGTNLKSSVQEYALVATKASPQPLVLLKLWGFVFSSLPYSSYCRCHYCSQTWKFHCLASYSWYSWYSWYCLWILTMPSSPNTINNY